MNTGKFYATVRDGKYHNRAIKYMLESPLYKGIAHYKGNNCKNKKLALT